MDQLVYSENDDKCTELSDCKNTYKWIHKHTLIRVSERTARSDTISSPTIRQTLGRPVNALERWEVKRVWSMLNEILNDCGMATKLVHKEINNNHWAYWKVYRMASQVTVQITNKRWIPRCHSNLYHCQRTAHSDWTGGYQGAQLDKATAEDDDCMAYQRVKKRLSFKDTWQPSHERLSRRNSPPRPRNLYMPSTKWLSKSRSMLLLQWVWLPTVKSRC